MPSFADIHNKKPENVKRPPHLPFGSYIAAVDGPALFGKTTNGYEQWTVKSKLLQPLADVDKDELMKWKDITGESVMGQHVYQWFNEALYWMLTEWLTQLGLGQVEYPQCMSEIPGRQFVVHLGPAARSDGKEITHTVKSTSALPK